MTELRNWLLRLAHETMVREGAEDAAHDYDHLVRVIALAETIYVTLEMSCSSGKITVADQEQLLAKLYAGCTLPGGYASILES